VSLNVVFKRGGRIEESAISYAYENRNETMKLAQSTLINRNIKVANHRTSMRLERSMWNALEEIAEREGKSIHDLATLVDSRRNESSLTAAMRVFALSYFRAASTDVGHIRAGHGVNSLSTGGGSNVGRQIGSRLAEKVL